MFFQRLNKRAEGGVEEVARWILYIGIIIAVGFAIRKLAMQFG
jgi:hypothetical protein